MLTAVPSESIPGLLLLSDGWCTQDAENHVTLVCPCSAARDDWCEGGGCAVERCISLRVCVHVRVLARAFKSVSVDDQETRIELDT